MISEQCLFELRGIGEKEQGNRFVTFLCHSESLENL